MDSNPVHGDKGSANLANNKLSQHSPRIKPAIPDFEVQNHFTIYLLCPLTDAAIGWVDENLPEDVMTFGRGIVVEHRFIADIVRGIVDSGLVVR
jgi:hypothetical protein